MAKIRAAPITEGARRAPWRIASPTLAAGPIASQHDRHLADQRDDQQQRIEPAVQPRRLRGISPAGIGGRPARTTRRDDQRRPARPGRSTARRACTTRSVSSHAWPIEIWLIGPPVRFAAYAKPRRALAIALAERTLRRHLECAMDDIEWRVSEGLVPYAEALADMEDARRGDSRRHGARMRLAARAPAACSPPAPAPIRPNCSIRWISRCSRPAAAGAIPITAPASASAI